VKKVAVIQSNYIPWKGYFDIINDADLFVFYDDVQFTKNDWRNRNMIKTPQGRKWLSIPVGSKIHRLIHEVKIDDTAWGQKHWQTIYQFYSQAPYFANYKEFFEHVYLEKTWENLSDLNQFLIKHIAYYLTIKTKFMDSRELHISGSKQQRLLDLLKAVGADTYISGPAAQRYIDLNTWEETGIKLVYKNYEGYPEYPQLYPPFNHFVSVIDLLFNVGPDASYYIWGWRQTG
jgi:hypothetical protein